MKDQIIIRIIDQRTGSEFDYPLDASVSDELLGAILSHVGYSGDGTGAMKAAIDFWIGQSRSLLENQIRSKKASEGEADVFALRAKFGDAPPADEVFEEAATE